MAGGAESSAHLTLREVASALNVSARQVQYLRETQVLLPAVVRSGRGHSCLYSVANVEMAYLALVELEDLGYEAKREVLAQVPDEPAGMLEFELSDLTTVRVDWDGLRNRVKRLVDSAQRGG